MTSFLLHLIYLSFTIQKTKYVIFIFVLTKALTKYERPKMPKMQQKTAFWAGISFHFRPFVFRALEMIEQALI